MPDAPMPMRTVSPAAGDGVLRRGPTQRYAPRADVPPTDGEGLGGIDRPGRHRDRGLRVIVACDHRGYDAKVNLLPKLALLAGPVGGCEAIDLGCASGSRACDYPDYAAPAARMVAAGEADVAVLLDGSGIGMGIVANKIPGIRAAVCHDEFTARIAREHNHCNVVCVGTELVGERALARVVEIFLTTRFSEGRHVRRVEKITAVENAAVEGVPRQAMRASS